MKPLSLGARLLAQARSVGPGAVLELRLRQFIDGLVGPREFYKSVTALQSEARHLYVPHPDRTSGPSLDALLADLAMELKKGRPRSTSPGIWVLRSRAKEVYSSLGNLRVDGELYFGYFQAAQAAKEL